MCLSVCLVVVGVWFCVVLFCCLVVYCWFGGDGVFRFGVMVLVLIILLLLVSGVIWCWRMVVSLR